MLERPRTKKATARQRTYRRRLRTSFMPVTVEVNAAIVAMLIATEWLIEADSGDRTKIGEALTAMLLDSTRNNSENG